MPKAPYYLGTNMVWYRHGNWNAWFPSHPTKSETLALSTNMLMYKVRQTQARYHGIVPYHIIPVTLLWHRYGMVVWYHHHHTTIMTHFFLSRRVYITPLLSASRQRCSNIHTSQLVHSLHVADVRW